MIVLRRLWARPDLRFCLLAFLVGRVAFSLLSVAGWYLPYEQPEAATHWAAPDPAHGWLNAFVGLERFDAQWYLQIARDGYVDDDPSSAFFPLYPLLVRGVAVLVGGHWLLAATLVSNIALLAALVLLYRLTAAELSPTLARPTVLFLLLNPMAMFLYAPYSESVFLLLVLACITWLRHGRWAAAAAAAALASATRSTGLVLGIAMGVQALAEVSRPLRAKGARALVGKLALSACAGLGVVAYLLYWAVRSSWDTPLEVQRTAFRRQPSWPWVSMINGVRGVQRTWNDPSWLIINLGVLLTILILLLGVVAMKRYPPVYKAYFVASAVMPLCLVRPYAPLISVSRYYLVLFPVWWALAELTQRRFALRVVVMVASSVILCLLTLLLVSWHDVL